jgi:hypothetical protein
LGVHSDLAKNIHEMFELAENFTSRTLS